MEHAELDEFNINTARRLKRARKISFILSSLMFFGGLVWLLYITNSVQELQKEKEALESQVAELVNSKKDLLQSQKDILDFLKNIMEDDNIRFIDPSVNWEKTRSQIIDLNPGQRKNVILSSLLLAWKNLPFKMGGTSPSDGFDSSSFVRFVLEKSGINVQLKEGEVLSEAMMRQFKKVDKPLPGDLIIYQGQLGNFMFIYASPGDISGKGVGVGHLQASIPISVWDTKNVRTNLYPFIGYYRPDYKD